jgi:bisphosphoglycerate-independent phosphoglycerate mutase (AlkP superfamily)
MMEVGSQATPMSEAIKRAYEWGQEDETLEPLVLMDQTGAVGRMKKGDYVIFYNIRGEREIQLTRSLAEKGFAEFERDLPSCRGAERHAVRGPGQKRNAFHQDRRI